MMKKIKRYLIHSLKGYTEWGKLLYDGIIYLTKLVYKYPRHSIFVTLLTTIVIVIATTILLSDEMKVLPNMIRYLTIAIISICTLLGSIHISRLYFRSK